MKEKEKEKTSKKLKKAAITATTAASILISNTYDDADELLKREESSDPVIEQYLEKQENSSKSSIKRWINKLPYAVKLLVVAPLYAIGWAISSLLSLIYTNFLSGYMADIIYWLILIAVIIMTILVSSKLIYPDLPISKYVNKENISYIIVTVVTLAFTDKIVAIKYPGYARFSSIVHFVGCLVIILIFLCKTKIENPKKNVSITHENYNITNY